MKSRLRSRVLPHAVWLSVLAAGSIAACSSGTTLQPVTTTTPDASTDSGPTTVDGGGIIGGDPFDQPLDGLSADLLTQFNDGDHEFDLVLRPYDGLGPLYTRPSCGACHDDGSRGPGLVQKMVIVDSNDITPSPDQSLLPFGNTVHPLVVTDITGAMTPIVPPLLDGGIDGGDAGEQQLRVTIRLGPPVLGRGYMEAIADSEILRIEAEEAKRTDGIHGRANHTTFASVPNPDQTYEQYKTNDAVIGRFGLKARIATLDEFVADAMQGDMGMTTVMRPNEFANPDGVTDDLKPGTDLDTDKLNVRAMYLRLLAIPLRKVDPTGNGEALFEQVACNGCHVKSLHTRADYPVKQLADIEAPVYTDMLLHDMGDDLADGVAGGVEGMAGPRDWRTAPLLGLRFNRVLMHDGRASSVEDAILKHAGNGSEAQHSVDLFNALSATDRKTLLDFVGAL
ncbi:MAG TPA: di-heme oxidoredictase family protein [Polyangiaceae bacterium]